MNIVEKILNLAPSLRGVFTYTDLFHLMGARTELKTNRMIRRLVQDGTLFKIKRGFYTTKNPDLWVLACRIREKSYISMDSVLSRNGLIGTVPQRGVSAIYSGQGRRIVKTPFGTIFYYSIREQLIFGVSRAEGGIRMADSEKAYLDILYYYLRGVRFVINPLQEVLTEKLDRKKLAGYLKHYRNPKFVKFVKGVLHE
ncbi:MAG: type IV toxin-antitoxin system AbiEi family antitoxin domain-containing protein [Deltaproteobacteria bacterium]|nr:type IV toxin-antitoxin system AbiEi family antitoxin domain-containing protein [Deltaproteobacteria bacterium]MBI4224414.1 type IV toxin-antitoxin system AbiEi family antitoxin domain-containing protein [Deltaproteobacteria bacterium]